MERLQCEFCGGSLLMDESGEFAACKNCGMEFKKETIKKMIVELSGPVSVEGIASIEGLNKRAYLFLEDGDFGQAAEYFNKILDIDPEYALAYVGLLMAELEMRDEQYLPQAPKDLGEYPAFQKAVRFSDDDLKQRLNQYAKQASSALKEHRTKITAIAKRLQEELNTAQFEIVEPFTIKEKARKIEGATQKLYNEILSLKTKISFHQNKIKTLSPIFDRKKIKEHEEKLSAINSEIRELEREKRKITEKPNLGKIQYEWEVLYVSLTRNEALVITRNCVIMRQFDGWRGTIGNGTDWANSTLRQWLYERFVPSIPLEIKERMIEIDFEYERAINHTGDKVEKVTGRTRETCFCLSLHKFAECVHEAPITIANYLDVPCYWWLSDANDIVGSATLISPAGDIRQASTGYEAGVRPAMWIKF